MAEEMSDNNSTEEKQEENDEHYKPWLDIEIDDAYVQGINESDGLEHGEGWHSNLQEEGRWISDEQNTEHDTASPAAKQSTSGGYSYRISFDRARRSVWQQAEQEFKRISKNLRERGIDDALKLLRLFYGPSSSLMHVICNEYQLSYHDACRFLATFYKTALYNTSLATLCADPDFENVMEEQYLSPTEYHAIWASTRQHDVNQYAAKPTWILLETAINDLCHKIVISGVRPFDKQVYVIDDNKVHHQWGNDARFCGLKRAQHVRDNRRGFTCHEMVASASCILVGSAFERETDTTLLTTKRLIRSAVGQRTGDGEVNLARMILKIDRGYFGKDLRSFILKNKGDLVATSKRTDDIPFTYGKTRSSKNDSQIEISLKGYKNAFHEVVDCGENRTILYTAYRSGTGSSVSILGSTIHRPQHWDFNLKFTRDYTWYFDTTMTRQERHKKAFPIVEVIDETTMEDDEEYRDKLMDVLITVTRNARVNPRTTTQGNVEWFVDRMFRLTSSTVDKVIRVLAKHITSNHEMREAFEIVLEYAGLLRLLPKPVNLAAPAEEDDKVQEDNESESDNEQLEGQTNDIETTAKVWLKRIYNDNNEQDEAAFYLKEALPNLSDAIYVHLLNYHVGGERIAKKSIATQKKQVILWINAPRAHRKYFFMSNSELRDTVKEKQASLRGTQPALPSTKPTLLARITRLDSNDMSQEGGLTADEKLTSDLVFAIMKASFMVPLKGKAKQYARLGHKLERVFIQRFANAVRCEVEKGKGWDVMSVHECGSVQQGEFTYSTDSSDAVAIFEQQTEPPNTPNTTKECEPEEEEEEEWCEYKVIPIEIKARVTWNTMHAEFDKLESMFGIDCLEDVDKIFTTIDCEDIGLVNKLINKDHEAFQLLHHVWTYQSDAGILMIGDDRDVNLILKVKYCERLKNAYGQIIKYLYERVLCRFYKPTEEVADDPFVKMALEDPLFTKKLKMSKEDFVTQHGLWHCLTFPKNDPLQKTLGVRFPMPPCARLIPMSNSSYNSGKGGSDTNSYLAWMHRARLPKPTAETAPIAFQLSSIAIMCHRIQQLMSGHKTLNEFASLQHYRNSACKRRPYRRSLTTIINFLQSTANQGNTSNALLSSGEKRKRESEEKTPTLRRKTRSVQEVHEVCWTSRTTGGTSQQGRPFVAKDITIHREADLSRQDACFGNPVRYMAWSKKKKQIVNGHKICVVCKMKTPFVCTHCKRGVCLDKDRRDRLLNPPTEKSRKKAEALPKQYTKEELGPKIIAFQSIDPISKETTTMYGMKTCWHIHHATGLNALYCQPLQTNDTDWSENESDE